MATYISKATGNWDTTSTWAPAATGASCAQPTHSTTQTIAGNASVTSGTFTITNAQIIDGVLLWIRGGATGTVTVELLKGGVSQSAVTVNNADIPAGAQGCVFFKFTSTHTSDGSSTYAIKVSVSSGGSTVTFYRDGTAANFARQLRQTAAASAAAAGDVWVVTGELTGAGTNNTWTVTMDDPGTNAYGTNTQTVATIPHTTQNGVDIGWKGTLTWATVSGTYQLHLKGHCVVWAGGTLNIGTTGTPMPNGVVGELYFDNDANVKFGLEIGDQATVALQGLSKSHMKYLNGDVAAAATALVLDATPTNWKDQDEVAIASTTRTNSECEIKTINGTVSTTTVNLTAGLTNAHAGGGGTSGALVKAEVINVTRNVRIKGNSGFYAYVTNINPVAGTNFDADYAEFKYMGSATTGKRGVQSFATTTSSFDCNGCVVRDSSGQASAIGFGLMQSSGLSYSLTNCVGWDVPSDFIQNTSTSATGWTINNCVGIKCGSFTISDLGGTFTNNTGVSVSTAMVLSDSNAWGTVSNLITHSSVGIGVQITGIPASYTLSTILSYRNGTYGLTNSVSVTGLIFSSITLFGNTTAGFNTSGSLTNFTLSDWTVDGGLVLVQPRGIYVGSNALGWHGHNVLLGSNSAHTASDMFIQNSSSTVFMEFENSIFGSTLEVETPENMTSGSLSNIISKGHDQNATTYRKWTPTGGVADDKVVYDVSPQSIRLTPASASVKLEAEVGAVEVLSGNAVAFTVKVRKSVIGDGVAYNGNQPRLIVKRNEAAGISADAVLATATNSANGAWLTLSGTTAAVTADCVLQFIIDCDGTAGWVNADTATATNTRNDNGNMNYGKDGTPFVPLMAGGGFPKGRVVNA